MSSTTSALSPLERAPYDIHFAIFRYACTDGGRAGATLTRTSRTVAAAVAPFRFHSLRLTSLRQIGQLLLCHEHTIRTHHVSSFAKGKNKNTTGGPRMGLNAQHLLLSFLPGTGHDELIRQWRGCNEHSIKRHKRRGQMLADERAREAAKVSWDRQFVFLVPRLFSLVAPTLRSLVVLQSADIPLPYVGGVQFPVLRELALLGDDRMFVQEEPDRSQEPSRLFRDEILYDVFDEAPWAFDDALPFIDGTPRRSLFERSLSLGTPGSRAADADADMLGDFTVPNFPALTHFHIVDEGMFEERLWKSKLQRWTRLAPAVTHLRVSQANKRVLEMLTASSSHQPGPNFPRLERTIVQPFVLEPEPDHEVVEEDHVLSRTRGAHGGATVVLMHGRWFRRGYWEDRLRGAWEERMVGGLGCWAESSEPEGRARG